MNTNSQAGMVYDANKKSLVVAYLLWWFLGAFGAHRLYAGRILSAIFMLVITLISAVLVFVLIGYLGVAFIAVWWLLDAFLLPGMIRESNLRLIGRLT